MFLPVTLFTITTIYYLTEARVSLGLLEKGEKKPKPSEYGNRPRGVPLSRKSFLNNLVFFLLRNIL